jgi:hypothetical protein
MQRFYGQGSPQQSARLVKALSVTCFAWGTEIVGAKQKKVAT